MRDNGFKLGEKYQKERVLDSLEREISISRAKVEELEKTKRDEKERQRLNETISEKERLAVRLAFGDYTKEKGGKEGYQRIKKVINSPILGYKAGEHFSKLLDDLIEDKNYQQVLKFLADPKIDGKANDF